MLSDLYNNNNISAIKNLGCVSVCLYVELEKQQISQYDKKVQIIKYVLKIQSIHYHTHTGQNPLFKVVSHSQMQRRRQRSDKNLGVQESNSYAVNGNTLRIQRHFKSLTKLTSNVSALDMENIPLAN